MTSTMGMNQTTFWTPDPVSYTRAAVATIGITKFTRGCLSHALQVIRWLYISISLSHIITPYITGHVSGQRDSSTYRKF